MKKQNIVDALKESLNELAMIVCDELCKYRESADKDFVCDYMRERGGECPMDQIAN